MSKSIQNLPQLDSWEGEPFKLSKEGAEEILSLAEWVQLIVGTLNAPVPGSALTMQDLTYASDILRKCVRCGEILELSDEEYKWLVALLMDESMGRRINPQSVGAYGINVFRFVAVALHTALTSVLVGEVREPQPIRHKRA